jgi:hypothetical protein
VSGAAEPGTAEPDGSDRPSEPAEAAERPPRRRRNRKRALIGLGLWLLVVLPLVVGLVAQRSPRWYPVADLAQTELRVRDVGGPHTPQIGLAGRIGDYFDAGSHPGPLSFWALAPTYRLLGSTAWAFEAAAVVLHAIALGLVIWIANRRGGIALMAAVAGALVVLGRYYGPVVFFEPWNPYLPVSWWLVWLFSLWSILEDDWALIPLGVVAGSFAAQTHLPYLGLVGGSGALMVAPIGVALWQRWKAPDRAEAWRLVRWTVGGLVLGVLLWIPPVIDQVSGTGNATKIVDSLRNPTERVTGVGRGAREVLLNIDPVRLVTGHLRMEVSRGGTAWWSVVLLVAWAAAFVIAALVLRHRRLVRLHAVLAVALALAFVSASRVYGDLWYYLFLWCWGLSALVFVAVAWTAAELVRRNLPPEQRPLVRTKATRAAVAVLVLVSGIASVHNRDAQPSRRDLSDDLGVLARETIRGIGDRTFAVGPTERRRYLVRWNDPITIGSQGIGLVNELERVGYDVGVDQGFGAGAVRYRVLPESKASAIIQLAVGPAMDQWDARPDADRIAYVDSRTPAERREFDRLFAGVGKALRAAGLPDVAEEWKLNLFTATLRPEVPKAIQHDMLRALDLGAPAAVYLVTPRTG